LVDLGRNFFVDSCDISSNIILQDWPIDAMCCQMYNLRPRINFGQELNKWPTETIDVIRMDLMFKEFLIIIKGRGNPLQVVLLDKEKFAVYINHSFFIYV
jgi:hypothetical protein